MEKIRNTRGFENWPGLGSNPYSKVLLGMTHSCSVAPQEVCSHCNIWVLKILPKNAKTKKNRERNFREYINSVSYGMPLILLYAFFRHTEQKPSTEVFREIRWRLGLV